MTNFKKWGGLERLNVARGAERSPKSEGKTLKTTAMAFVLSH